jgi:hypothetical protein
MEQGEDFSWKQPSRDESWLKTGVGLSDYSIECVVGLRRGLYYQSFFSISFSILYP